MTGLAGLPPPPGSLRVEVVEVGPPHALPGTRALSVVSRLRGRRILGTFWVLSGITGAITTGGVSAIVKLGVAAAGVSIYAERSQPLVVLDDAVATPDGERVSLAGVTDVTLSALTVRVHRGGERWVVYKSARIRPRLWIARLLREVVALGHLPVSLTLPAARVR